MSNPPKWFGNSHLNDADDPTIGYVPPSDEPSKPTQEQLEELWAVVHGFIKSQEITGSECIHQCDRVITNAYQFIEDCCDVVGYHERDEDGDNS